MQTTQPKIEVKSVKHLFTLDERDALGGEIAQQLAKLRGLEAELQQVKDSYKAKTSECEAKIDSLTTQRINGFEFRNKRCRVDFRPKERRKLYFLEDAPADAQAVAIEDMTAADFQADLIQAEAKFEHREEIELFKPVGNDRGVMAVGKFNGTWFAALRVNIGTLKVEERLDSEQACAKKRHDIIKRSSKRFLELLTERAGRDVAKGFEQGIAAVIDAQKEREE
jgi:hypothetical protein